MTCTPETQPLIIILLPHLLSAITIWMMVLAGNRHPRAWALGLANNMVWLIYIVASSTWGLLWMNVALWYVYYRNHLKSSLP